MSERTTGNARFVGFGTLRGSTLESTFGRLRGRAIGSEMELEREIKELIVEALMLDDVKPEDIDSAEPLFVTGLGLDSIDALELAMAVEKKFGVRIRPDDEQNRNIFASVKNLAAYVSNARG